MNGEKQFRREYPETVMDSAKHYYCIAREGSKTSAAQYVEFCRKCDLELREVSLDVINPDSVEASFEVRESLFDPHKLKEVCLRKLGDNNVNIIYREVTPAIFGSYDFVVIATYATLNELLAGYPGSQAQYQFEVCEKPVVSLPQCFNEKSVVVMDGPFMCVDPYGSTKLFVLGNVERAIWNTNTGLHPEVPDKLRPYLNRGVVKDPPQTKFSEFMQTASVFFPEITKAKHLGSMFTVRTVPAYREHDDARPTIVTRVSDRIIRIFSGKIPTCVDAADQVVKIVSSSRA